MHVFLYYAWRSSCSPHNQFRALLKSTYQLLTGDRLIGKQTDQHNKVPPAIMYDARGLPPRSRRNSGDDFGARFWQPIVSFIYQNPIYTVRAF